MASGNIVYICSRRNGKKCLEEVTGRPVVKVLDPTLTLEEDHWRKKVGEPIVEDCEECTSKIVSEEAKKLNLPVIVIDARKWQNKNRQKWGFTLCKKSGPMAFLNLMYYGKRCYVESFHGMVFAYIFRKDFWLLDNHKSYDELDIRLKEFVELLGMKERLLTPYNVEKIDQNEKNIYSTNKILKQMRKVSRDFLDNAFAGGNP